MLRLCFFFRRTSRGSLGACCELCGQHSDPHTKQPRFSRPALDEILRLVKMLLDARSVFSDHYAAGPTSAEFCDHFGGSGRTRSLSLSSTRGDDGGPQPGGNSECAVGWAVRWMLPQPSFCGSSASARAGFFCLVLIRASRSSYLPLVLTMKSARGVGQRASAPPRNNEAPPPAEVGHSCVIILAGATPASSLRRSSWRHDAARAFTRGAPGVPAVGGARGGHVDNHVALLLAPPQRLPAPLSHTPPSSRR